MKTTRDALIQSISQNKSDPRTLKWENKIILDTLQENDSYSVSELLKAIESKFECDPPIFTYNQLYSYLHVLLVDDIVSANPLTKKYSIKPEYITVTEQIKYLPVSNYCVGLFSLSIIGLVASLIFSVRVSEASLLVIAGGMYLFCQLIGSEYNFEERKETSVIVNGVKSIHQKILDMATPQKEA